MLRVQQWAVTFGKEIAAMSARYSGAKLLQKVRAHTPCIKIGDIKTARPPPNIQSEHNWLLYNICTWPRDQGHDTLKLNTLVYTHTVVRRVYLESFLCCGACFWKFSTVCACVCVGGGMYRRACKCLFKEDE